MLRRNWVPYKFFFLVPNRVPNAIETPWNRVIQMLVYNIFMIYLMIYIETILSVRFVIYMYDNIWKLQVKHLGGFFVLLIYHKDIPYYKFVEWNYADIL